MGDESARSALIAHISFLLTRFAKCCRITRTMQITFREKKWEVPGGTTARDTIKKIGIDPESVLVVVNGKLATDDVILKDKDEVKLVAVVSGGSAVSGQRPACVQQRGAR